MKTLLERLKPEYLEILENEKTKFPNLVELIKLELQNCYFFTEFKLGVSYSLCDFCGVNLGLVEINNLFEKHE